MIKVAPLSKLLTLLVAVAALLHPYICLGQVIINEVDADTPGTDYAEFIELYDSGVGHTDLSGYVLVLYNGSTDLSYAAYDFNGQSTDANGYFVLCGHSSMAPNCDGVLSDSIQNGTDAVALYTGNSGDFPDQTPVKTTNLVDAIVYDTNDSDDPGLLVLLNANEPQINENGDGNSVNDSNQRCPNGTGGEGNTATYMQYPPTPGTINICNNNGVVQECGNPATFIHTIQGNTMTSPVAGSLQEIEGVVVADFQTSSYLSGFFVQEEDSDEDDDPTTSEGIFIYDGASPVVDVTVGDIVRITGQVHEHYGMTEMRQITSVQICPSGGTASAATVTLPVTNMDDWEQYEGMLINIAEPLYVTDNYYLGRYGEVELSIGAALNIPTNVAEPGPEAINLADLNNRSRIKLDDGRTIQNPAPPSYIGDGGTLRRGDTLAELTGVLHYAFGTYKVQPTSTVDFLRINNRNSAPFKGVTTLKVASFNVLNYFSTLDESGAICGPDSDQGCRGADNRSEFIRQRDKIIAAIVEMDADVLGLIEIENHLSDAALQDLIEGLNDSAGLGTYASINTGPIGADAIKVALIYRPATITPIGSHAILDSTVDPDFNDQKNRPVLAQTFQERRSQEKFTVAVNHLKSKGSDCTDIGDPDTGDGQGNCNLTRTAAATALVKWLATDPTGSGDADYLIIGDLNSYAKEDPIDAIKASGYSDLIASLPAPYTFVYNGQAGYLDHALASSSMGGQVTGVSIWHISADEPSALDYNDSNQSSLYAANQYRASDHDAVIINLDFQKSDGELMPAIIALLLNYDFSAEKRKSQSMAKQKK